MDSRLKTPKAVDGFSVYVYLQSIYIDDIEIEIDDIDVDIDI